MEAQVASKNAANGALGRAEDWQLAIQRLKTMLSRGHDDGISKVAVSPTITPEWGTPFEAHLNYLHIYMPLGSPVEASQVVISCGRARQWQMAISVLADIAASKAMLSKN